MTDTEAITALARLAEEITRQLRGRNALVVFGALALCLRAGLDLSDGTSEQVELPEIAELLERAIAATVAALIRNDVQDVRPS